MSFDELGLRAELLRAVADSGYDRPTPVQTKAIPVVLEGRDLMAGAQTGTGKTAAFTLPLLHNLTREPVDHRAGSPKETRPIRALILTPTRELAAQVLDSVNTYGRHLPVRATAIFGGVGAVPQIRTLRKGVDILVATPGRLLEHIGTRAADLSRVEVLVLDEADRMLDMGFIRDIRRILGVLPRKRQNLLFSATFPDEIKKLADELLNKPEMIQVTTRNAPPRLVSQSVHLVDKGRKREALSHLITAGSWRQVLVFTRTKRGADRLTRALVQDGIAAVAIHGNKAQAVRTRALRDFKRGSIRVLVATDIAARGLDIDQLPHVVNFELPHVPEDYVHRIGRTGRAGNDGAAVSLVCIDEKPLLAGIERLLGREIPRAELPGFRPDPRIRPEPIAKGRTTGAGAQGSRPAQGRRGGGKPGAAGERRQGSPARPGGKPRRPKASGTSRNPTRPAGEQRSAAAPAKPAAAPAPAWGRTPRPPRGLRGRRSTRKRGPGGTMGSR